MSLLRKMPFIILIALISLGCGNMKIEDMSKTDGSSTVPKPAAVLWGKWLAEDGSSYRFAPDHYSLDYIDQKGKTNSTSANDGTYYYIEKYVNGDGNGAIEIALANQAKGYTFEFDVDDNLILNDGNNNKKVLHRPNASAIEQDGGTSISESTFTDKGWLSSSDGDYLYLKGDSTKIAYDISKSGSASRGKVVDTKLYEADIPAIESFISNPQASPLVADAMGTPFVTDTLTYQFYPPIIIITPASGTGVLGSTGPATWTLVSHTSDTLEFKDLIDGKTISFHNANSGTTTSASSNVAP